MAKDVKVIITLSAVAGKAEFGYPLILAGNQTKAVPYTECANLDEVKALFEDDTAVYKAAQLLFMQNNAPDKIAVCGADTSALDAINANLDKGWRQLIVPTLGQDGESTAAAIAEKIETTDDKMFFTSVTSVDKITGFNDLDRTVIFVYSKADTYPEAALVGATAGKPVGSFTYKNMILKGLEPEVLTDAQISAIHTAGGLTFVTKAGDNVTTEGKTQGGEYIDIIDSKDYIISKIEYQTQRILNLSDKVPYDNNGIAMLESVCVNVLKDAYNNGIIAVDADGAPDYSVSYGGREETDANDRLIRKYILGKFRFALAGAIHTVEIKGEIEI